MLEGVPEGNSGVLPLGAPGQVSEVPATPLTATGTFVRERDDTAEIYCTRAAQSMLPSEALQAVLGGNVNNCNEQCNTCRGCYG